MKTLISHLRAKFRGMRGARKHSKVVANVFTTRDALYTSASHMQAEIEANSHRVGSILDRNSELREKRRHAKQVADRLAELFHAP